MTSTTTHFGETEPFAPSADSSPETRWKPATLIAFRFSFAYFVLEWLALIAFLNTPALSAGALNGPSWWRTVNFTIGQWSITYVLGLPEHSPPRFSANALPLFLGSVSLGVISAAVAVAWSALDRRRVNHARLFIWTHTFMRFMLGAALLGYGWHKVLPGQFPLTFDYLTLEVGQHSPRDLLWAFMGASREYQVFTGLVEVGAGLLLLVRRTAMLGALVSMAAMANVLALDIAYDAGVKFLAGQMFLMTLFILAPFATRLARVFVFGDETRSTWIGRLFQQATADRVARTVGLVFAAWIVYSTFQYAERQVIANENARHTPLYGIWNVEGIARNGVAVPLLWTDTTLWRRVVIQSTDAALIVPMSDSEARPPNAARYSYEIDGVAHTVRFTPFKFSGTTRPLTFAYLLPDRDHLVLDGRNGDEAIVVRLRRFDPSTYTLVGWRRSWWW